MVCVFPVFATRMLNCDVPLLDSILYPVIAEPPSLDGGLHDKLILVAEDGLALRVGEPGMVVT